MNKIPCPPFVIVGPDVVILDDPSKEGHQYKVERDSDFIEYKGSESNA